MAQLKTGKVSDKDILAMSGNQDLSKEGKS